MNTLLTAFWLFLAAAACLPASAQDLRPTFLLTGALQRDTQDLSGQWTYSKDLYRTGLNDINGWVAKSRMQRFRDVDVAAVEAARSSTCPAPGTRRRPSCATTMA